MIKLEDNKHAFWQAFIVALIIFWTGIMLGIWFESSRTTKLDDIYTKSETDIFDIELESDILKMSYFDCDIAMQANINFAEQIYEEAKKLEKYDSSNKITEDVAELHRRYDLLRTMLWVNTIEFKKLCPDKTNSVVYLYQYTEPGIETQAKQITFSKVLLDLKKKYREKIILIPIASDAKIKSLDLLKHKYNITVNPVVIINEKYIISKLSSLEELEKYIV